MKEAELTSWKSFFKNAQFWLAHAGLLFYVKQHEKTLWTSVKQCLIALAETLGQDTGTTEGGRMDLIEWRRGAQVVCSVNWDSGSSLTERLSAKVKCLLSYNYYY